MPFFALWAKAEQPDRRATDSKTRIRVSPSISITSPNSPSTGGGRREAGALALGSDDLGPNPSSSFSACDLGHLT